MKSTERWVLAVPFVVGLVLWSFGILNGAWRVPAVLLKAMSSSPARYHELEVRWNAKWMSIGELHDQLSGMADAIRDGDDAMLVPFVELSAELHGPTSETYAGVLENLLPSVTDERLSHALAKLENRRSFALAFQDATRQKLSDPAFEKRWPRTARLLH